ncbi:MAG: hypothetical protein ACJ731_12230 [Vicinamibacterales bacterium]
MTTPSATSMAAALNQRAPAIGGRTAIRPVTTRYAVSNAAGTLIAGPTLRTTAITIPHMDIVSIAYTNRMPLLRCSEAPFVE